MLSRVIVAVEDSKFAQSIERQLSQINWDQPTTFRVVHVIEPSDEFLAWPSEEIRAEAEILLDSFASNIHRLFPNSVVQKTILNGRAGEAIIDDAITWEADLIVMGSHGKRGVRRFMLGSVASTVSNNAPCSVLIIRPAERVQTTTPLSGTKEAAV